MVITVSQVADINNNNDIMIINNKADKNIFL